MAMILALFECGAQVLNGFLRLVGFEQRAGIEQAHAGDLRIEFEGAGKRRLGATGSSAG